jgi:hypothetical protein
VAFIVTWISPYTLGTRAVWHLSMVILLEFIVMHSSAFVGVIGFSELSRTKRTLAIVGLSAFYFLFAWAFSVGFESNWPMLAFFGLTLNRLLGTLIGQTPEGAEKVFVAGSWIISGVTYLLGVALTSLASLPRLGVTDEVIRAQGFTSGGLFTEQPHVALAFGALYFTVQTFWSLFGRFVILRATGGGRSSQRPR